MTTHPNENPQRPTRKSSNSPMAWAMGGAFFIALLFMLFVYNGSDTKPKSGENPPPSNMVTGAGQK